MGEDEQRRKKKWSGQRDLRFERSDRCPWKKGQKFLGFLKKVTPVLGRKNCQKNCRILKKTVTLAVGEKKCQKNCRILKKTVTLVLRGMSL